MRPLMYSTIDAKDSTIGWRRCGDNISYFRNEDSTYVFILPAAISILYIYCNSMAYERPLQHGQHVSMQERVRILSILFNKIFSFHSQPIQQPPSHILVNGIGRHIPQCCQNTITPPTVYRTMKKTSTEHTR